MTRTKVPGRLREVVTAATAAGWTFDGARNHPRLVPPSGLVDPTTGELAGPAYLAGTPSDRRGIRNTVAYLRRCGVVINRGR